MKFTCSTQIFSKAVGLAAIAIPTSGLTDLASVLLIKASKDQILISSVSKETNVEVKIAADIAEEGEIMLPAHVFADMIKRFSGDGLSFESDDKWGVTLKSGRTKCEITGADPAEFPTFPEIKADREIKISESVLGEMIKSTAFAASTNEQRPTIMGCLLDITDDNLRMVAIDGYRIAIVEYDKKSKGKDACKVNIPANALKDWAKISDNAEGDILLKVSEKNVLIEKNSEEMEIAFTSRVINGEFMDWQKFLPAEFANEITLEKDELIRAIERVSTVLTATQKAPIRVTFGGAGVNFSCETTIGKAEDDIEMKSELVTQVMGFNNRFLYEAVKNADGEHIAIKFNGPTDAILLTNPKKQEKNYKYLVLPVRL